VGAPHFQMLKKKIAELVVLGVTTGVTNRDYCKP